MKKFALIGNPISHSKSPELFRAAFPPSSENQESVQEEPMVYDLVEELSIDKSIARLRQEGYCGANVTAPFKESAMRFVTDPDPVSKTLGATNLILLIGDRIFSYNTDYLAVRRMVSEYKTGLSEADEKTSWHGVPQKVAALVIGCAGAGKAAALACRDEGLETLIINRTQKKAETFADQIKVKAINIAEADSMLKKTEGRFLVIYAIPAPDGVFSEVLKSCSQTGQGMICNNPDSRITVIEANYKDPCLNPESGLRWLKYQAVESFRLMTGIAPNESRFQ